MLQPNGNIKNQIWVSYQNSIYIPIQRARTSNFLEGFLFLIASLGIIAIWFQNCVEKGRDRKEFFAG